jgi:hypothetical protein
MVEESGSERDDAPVKKTTKASPAESIAKPASLASKPKSRPAPNFGKSRLEPTIMEEDENDENEPEERDSGKRKSKDGLAPVEVEKKKKRKIGAVAPLAPAFDFNGFLVSLLYDIVGFHTVFLIYLPFNYRPEPARVTH